MGGGRWAFRNSSSTTRRTRSASSWSKASRPARRCRVSSPPIIRRCASNREWRSRLAIRSRSSTSRRATRCGNMARTSARRSPISARASTCTCTISRPSGGDMAKRRKTKSNGRAVKRNGRSSMTFMGWRRESGRVGVRNHVVILPLDDLSNAACEAVANNVKGTLAIPHAYGRLQFGEDLDLFFRTMIGTGSNPNVAAVVVIGIEEGWTKRIVDGIKKTGKPVTGFGIELNGDINTIAKASRAAKDYLQWASEQDREECDISELWVSTKCGESDTTTGLASCPTVGNMYDKLIPKGIYGCFGATSDITGGEHIAKSRAATPKIGEKWMKVF